MQTQTDREWALTLGVDDLPCEFDFGGQTIRNVRKFLDYFHHDIRTDGEKRSTFGCGLHRDLVELRRVVETYHAPRLPAPEIPAEPAVAALPDPQPLNPEPLVSDVDDTDR